ncbi:hypothetical protein HYV86_01830 [Candidatus Woesearchaeota archaeon]|nr:hypothetical protein [Candidatus Woesearchaeota archaeon]
MDGSSIVAVLFVLGIIFWFLSQHHKRFAYTTAASVHTAHRTQELHAQEQRREQILHRPISPPVDLQPQQRQIQEQERQAERQEQNTREQEQRAAQQQQEITARTQQLQQSERAEEQRLAHLINQLKQKEAQLTQAGERETQLRTTIAELETLENQLKEAIEKQIAQTSDFNEKLEALRKDHIDSLKSVDDEQKKLHQLRSEIEAILAEKNRLEADVTMKNNELERLGTTTIQETEELNRLESKAADLRTQIGSHQNTIKSYTLKLNDLVRERAELGVKINLEETKLRETRMQQQALSSHIASKQQELERLEQEITRTEKNFSESKKTLGAEIAQKSREVQALENRQRELTQEISLLIQQISELERIQVQQNSQRILDLEAEINRLTQIQAQTMKEKEDSEKKQAAEIERLNTLLKEQGKQTGEVIKKARKRSTNKSQAQRLARGQFIFNVIYGIHQTIKALDDPTAKISAVLAGVKTRYKNAISTCDQLIEIVKDSPELVPDAQRVKSNLEVNYTKFLSFKINKPNADEKALAKIILEQEIRDLILQYEYVIAILKAVYGEEIQAVSEEVITGIANKSTFST